MTFFRRFWQLTTAIFIMVLFASTSQLLLAQDGSDEVDTILDSLSTEERIGQLFLITMAGDSVAASPAVIRLIQDYHVGGVILTASNNNFNDTNSLLDQVSALTADLQYIAAGYVRGVDGALYAPETEISGTYIPLFVGIEDMGQDWPYYPLLTGLTPPVSSMAIGATWDPVNAEAIGQILGAELASLGINLYLGPSADVVETAQSQTQANFGTRTFGGEPFWVASMVASFVSGMHNGSDGAVAVVPRHFPGYGSADRLAVEEIPTVRRSRDQLIQADLIPFFAVTGDAQDPLSVADGLLVGHIQYQGFGENLRSITRPLTFDQAALQNLMALEPLASWYVQGGLLISDALGVPGVRRYYDPQEQAFPTRLVAREAFAAGNDVLYLGDYSTSTFSTQTAAIADTIEYFIQRYQTDVVFRERVDQSVRRIIQQKLDMYGQFAVEDVIPAEGTVEQVGQGYNIALAVASQSLSVLPPGYNEPVNPPQRGDIILIFTDTRTVQQCASCTPSPLIRVDALRSEILRSYGPDATGTVGFANIIAYSFADLKDYLDNDVGGGDGENTPEPDPVESALAAADWIVFVSIGIDPEIPASSVVKQYLSEVQPGNDTRLVVMSMGAPYYLDTTEISKLSAYYVLYNYSAPSVAVAAQALFQEVAADGAPPVSVSSADYFILEATSPDPGQIINLSYELVARTQDMGEGTPTPTIEPVISLGDTLKLTTGVILDRNGNPVPDGTQVDFILSFINEGLRDNQAHATTGGRAEASVVLSRPGEIQITAISGDARNSETITVVVQDTGPAEISVQPPDLPTQTATPTDVLSVEPTEVVEAIEEPVATPEAESRLEQVANFDDLFLAGIGLLGIALVVFAVGSNTRSLNYGLLLTFPTLISGLLFYTYYALMLPGSAVWRQVFNSASRVWAASTAAWLGGLFGLAVAIVGINLYEQGTFLNLRNRNQG